MSEPPSASHMLYSGEERKAYFPSSPGVKALNCKVSFVVKLRALRLCVLQEAIRLQLVVAIPLQHLRL